MENLNEAFERLTNLYEISLDDIRKLRIENAALKEEKKQVQHCKGNQYTVLHENVLLEEYGNGISAKPHTVYVGEDGVKWTRPSEEFNDYKGILRRFQPL